MSTSSRDRSRPAQPSVVVAVTADVQPALDALRRRLASCDAGAAEHCRIVAAEEEDLPAATRRALAEVLDIRNPASGLLPETPWVGQPACPDVVLAASAVGLEAGAMRSLESVCRAVRSEFRRAQWDGSIAVLLYLGPVGDVLPKPDALDKVRRIDGIDRVLVFSDTDGLGRRIRFDDAARAAGEFLAQQLTHPAVRRMLRGHEPFDRDAAALAFGICRVDLSRQRLRRELHRLARNRLVAHLFAPYRGANGANGANGATGSNGGSGTAVGGQFLAGVYRGTNGSLTAVREAVGPARHELAAAAQGQRMSASAQRTRQMLLGLLPPPPAPPAPAKPPWWRRLILWLLRLWAACVRFVRWLLRRPQPPEPPAIPPRKPPVRRGVDIAALVQAERVKLQIQRLEAELRDETHDGDASARNPLDLALGDLPGVRQAMQEVLPDADRMAWHLVRQAPWPGLLGYLDQPERLRALLDAVVEKSLATVGELAAPEHCGDVVARLAAALVPFHPGCAEPTDRLVLVPPGTDDVSTVAEYSRASGASSEIVLIVVEPVSSLHGPSSEVASHDRPESRVAAAAQRSA